MSIRTRRHFLKDAALGVTAAAVLSHSKSHAAGPSERVRIGVIGCGNQGGNHIKVLSGLKDAQLVYVADIDGQRLTKAVNESNGAKGVADFRRILDDSTVDAVTIATPDHWHAPVALLALDAGKHVYVEKPCCHNVREGQLLREAAAQDVARVVAHGTQSRSSPSMTPGDGDARDGVIGDVLHGQMLELADCETTSAT